MKLEARIAALCTPCAELVLAGSYAEALAVAWLAIVDADAQEYATASRKSLIITDREQRAIELADRSYKTTAELASELRALAASGDVCGILLVLDRMLLTRAAPGSLPSLPTAGYSSGLMEVELPAQVLTSFGISEAASHCYVMRRPDEQRIAKLEAQHHHPFRHVPHWVVVRQHPDHAAPSVTVMIRTANVGLDEAFAALARAAVAKIYLAEFEQPPEFIPRDPANKERWVAVGLKNEGHVYQEVVEHLETAVAEGADVLVFPELVVTPAIRTEIANWLREKNLWKAEIGRPQLVLVVAGSFHILLDGGTEYSNETWALDAQGNVIDALTHRKICPVVLNMDDHVLTEDIQEGDRISMLSTGGGVHSLVICLDLAQGADTKLPLTKLPINWLWVPSLSGKVSPHRERAKLLTLSHFSIVSCANQGPAKFYPNAELSNPGTAMRSFVTSTRDTEPQYRQGRNWKIAIADMRLEPQLEGGAFAG